MGTIEIEIEGPAEPVWKALTSQEALRDWFNLTTEIEPRQGGHFRFEGTHGESPYQLDGTIARLTPEQLMTVEFASETRPQATLTFTLQPGDDHTTVEFRYDGFDESDDDSFWNGDELIALREYVTGIGPTY